ncbi:MAG: hypothetical protein LBV79_09210 [Candidatus Adiutrix sp.]|nr:hypothetical protein [Candidatus Adiutrix sp.]
MIALGDSLPLEEIRRWFEPLAWDYDPATGHLRVTAPTHFHRRRLTEAYADALALAAAEIGRPLLRELTLTSPEKSAAVVILPAPTPQPAAPRRAPHPGHTFESFIVAESNSLPYKALSELAHGGLYFGVRSVFLFCPGPWGKTHLLDALAARLSAEPGRRVIRVSAADFQAPPETESGLSILLDDAPLLAGREEAQRSLAQFLDESANSSGLVCASPVPPQRLAGVSEALRSRLSGGLTLRIEPPEYEVLLELGARQAQSLGLDFAPETLPRLVRASENDPRRLAGLIATVAFAAERGGASPDEAARRLYPRGGAEAEKPIGLDEILTAVSAAFGLKVADLTGHAQLRQAAWPRRVAMYLAKETTGLTTTKIGEAFGGRDHSTVIHALKKIRQELKNPAQTQLVENIRRSLVVGK